MSELIYHLESESRNSKNYLIFRLVHPSLKKGTTDLLSSLASTPSEKQGLAQLIKAHQRLFPSGSLDRLFYPAEDSFFLLKLLGSTGRLTFQGKKVVVDPFSSWDLCVEIERLTPASATLTVYCKIRDQLSLLSNCEWLFYADPSWAIQGGVIRAFKEEISAKWIQFLAQSGSSLEGKALFSFLEKAGGELDLVWKSSELVASVDPLPLLLLADRHGAFADLWFDYGALGKIAAEDATTYVWRNREVEKGWEKDLLETDFIKKRVDQTHYYCPLDKVAKSLTFLLEIGWQIKDSKGRRVLRQTKEDVDIQVSEEALIIQAKTHYAEHQVDLTDLLGAFNRREQFVELSSQSVALIDREAVMHQWGELVEEERVAEGIRLKRNRVGLLEGFQGLREDLRTKITALIEGNPSVPVIASSQFLGVLFPYQQQGLQWLQFLNEGRFGGLLADEMGLGKTVQVLAFFSQLPSHLPILVVTPTSLLFNWQREIEKFLPSLPVYRHEGSLRLSTVEELQKQAVILTSYALLRIEASLFQSLECQVVVLDEAQMIKNASSQIAEVCASLSSQVRVAITGTPIENRLEDLWSIFRFLQPDLLGDKSAFQAEIAAAQASSVYLNRIKKKIRPFILRRKKEEVALDLPEKLEQTVFVEMAEAERVIYDSWLQKTRQGVLKKVSLEGAGAHRMEILESILRLRQLCAHPGLVEKDKLIEAERVSCKFERLLSDLNEVIEERRKVLVYSQFTSMLHVIEAALKERGWKYVYLDGGTKNREEVVREFQEEASVHIFLISLKAGGVGLNLTAADYVFLYDPWWNEAVEAQAIDRAHRVGRRSSVIARRYITALSIEEKILKLKTHKKQLSQSLLDFDTALAAISLDELLSLLN